MNYKDFNLIMLNPFALQEALKEHYGINCEFIKIDEDTHVIKFERNGHTKTLGYFFVNHGPVNFEKQVDEKLKEEYKIRC